jgi:hypothetical protein
MKLVNLVLIVMAFASAAHGEGNSPNCLRWLISIDRSAMNQQQANEAYTLFYSPALARSVLTPQMYSVAVSTEQITDLEEAQTQAKAAVAQLETYPGVRVFCDMPTHADPRISGSNNLSGDSGVSSAQ